jgi:hypothetical protein
MRRLAIGLFALAAIGLAVPSAALADTVVIHKHRGAMYAPPRGPVYNYAPPARNKTVIIKHRNNY